ncbi:MAG: NAD-dependent epimerase/dehydratase family protein [Thermoplasmata archaeon]
MATIAITGAGGFIGSHLTDTLLARGDSVLALDIGRKVPPNLTDAAGHPGFAYRTCDVTRPSSVRKAFASRPDAVVHAAATVGVASYVRTPMETVESSVIGTRTVLRAAMRPKARFVYLSSSEVFGRNPAVPWAENADRVLGDPSLDRWSYSASKGLCEHLVNAAHTEYGAPTAIARPFNIYGARQRPAFVVPVTIHRVLNGEAPVIYGDGSQTRCFTYIADLVDALLLCLDRDVAVGQTFNFGNPRERTILEAIRLVLAACGSSLSPTHADPRVAFGGGFDEIPRRVPEVSKAARVLGWSAKTELPDGLAATVAWARAHPEWVRARAK